MPLSIPLAIPADLEEFIRDDLLPSIPNLPHHYDRNGVLIPIIDPLVNQASAILPSLRDSRAEAGNLRYWMINKENMWAGQHPILDELSEVYKAIHCAQSFDHAGMDPFYKRELKHNYDATEPDSILSLAHVLRRRTLGPACLKGHSRPASGINQREKLLFHAWILSDPARCNEGYSTETDDYGKGRRDEFDQDDYIYPIPESLFWTDGEEEQYPADYVPDWTEVAPTKDPHEERLRGSMRRIDSKPIKLPEEILAAHKEFDLGFSLNFVSFSCSAAETSDPGHFYLCERLVNWNREKRGFCSDAEGGDEDDDWDTSYRQEHEQKVFGDRRRFLTISSCLSDKMARR